MAAGRPPQAAPQNAESPLSDPQDAAKRIEEAQKLNARLPGRRAKLDEHIVEELARGEGRQLRSHPTAWREVGTLAATRHFLGALGVSSAPVLADYQAVADAAARRQLGPPRLSPKRH